MIKEALKNIFITTRQGGTAATIRRTLATGRYELADDAGRLLQADADVVWEAGSRVIVMGGRIVARTSPAKTIKTYEV